MSTILIAYERESDLSVLDELFTGRGHRVLRSNTGLEALEAARRDPPALVVSDILLPKMDGFALCRKWKQDERLRTIPFVFFTIRYDDPKYERFAEEVGADRFLARPSTPDALPNAVDELLAASKKPVVNGGGTGTERIPVLNEANLRLAAQVSDLQAQVRRLGESENNFRALFEASPCPLWVVDPETGRNVAVNDAALELLGYTRPDFLTLTPGALDIPFDIQREPLPPAVSWVRRKDGQALAVVTDQHTVQFNARQAQIVAACDISEHVERERTQLAGAMRDRAALDAIVDGYWLVAADGRIVDVNRAYCETSGYSRDELLQRSVEDIEVNTSGANTVRLHLERPAGGSRYQSRHRRKDDSLFDVEVTVGEIRDQDQRVMIIRDVSEQRESLVKQRLEERRLGALLELQQAGERLDENSLIQRTLEQAAVLTGSPIAFGFAVQPDRTLTVMGTSFDSRAGAWTPADWKRLAGSEVWLEVARAKRAMVMNEPESHLPGIERYLTVPLIGGEETALLLTVANRETPYQDSDRQELMLLADGMWRVIQGKRTYSRTMSGLQRADVAMQALISALSEIVEKHDVHTAGSSGRVAVLAVALARELGLDGEKQHVLRVAGMLHDVGMIAVPAALLAKPAKLSPDEFTLIKVHAQEGARLLADIDFGAPIAEIVHQHHERLDGSGYPRGLRADQILPEARILAVADVVEAMCSRRAWRSALPIEAALEEITQGSGTRYDADAVTACVRLFTERGFLLPG